MRGTSGRDAKISRPLSRSTASAPDPAPLARICEASAERVAPGPAARAAAGRIVAAASSTAMRRSVRAIKVPRVGNPPAGARLRLRSSPRAAIVGSMVNRRVLLPMLVAAFVLLGSGQALAEPTWLSGEAEDGTQAAQAVPADVATDSGGNSMAVWAASTATGGEVRAAYRPRGGPWGAPESLDGELDALSNQPRVAVQPDGEFIAVWIGSAT